MSRAKISFRQLLKEYACETEAVHEVLEHVGAVLDHPHAPEGAWVKLFESVDDAKLFLDHLARLHSFSPALAELSATWGIDFSSVNQEIADCLRGELPVTVEE